MRERERERCEFFATTSNTHTRDTRHVIKNQSDKIKSKNAKKTKQKRTVVSPIPKLIIFASGFFSKCALRIRAISGNKYPARSCAMFGFRETFDIAAILTLILSRRFGCSFVRCFEEDEESCLPKRDEVLVVIENMIGGFKLVCVMYIYIYIYINAGVLLEFDERGKKSGVCVSFCSFLRRQTFS